MIYICPICKKELKLINKSYKCSNNHTFDVSASGYTNLLVNSKKSHGDNAMMVKARKQFHAKDFYKPLKDQINNIINEYPCNNLLDLACGEGYYTSSFTNAKNVIGIDLSKEAIISACKKDHRTHYIIASIFNVPISDESCDIITTIFAPIAQNEIERLLKKDGIFIEVYPNINHLLELKKVLYQNIILNKVKISSFNSLTYLKTINVNNRIKLNNEDLMSLFYMTPYAYKTSLEATKKLQDINELEVTIDFNINIYQK